mgnify:CR=1 FL=1
MPSSLQLAQGHAALTEVVRDCRKMLHRRSLVAAGASMVPIPGLDWAVDAALLSRLIPQINARFGLTPEQMARLGPSQRDQVQKAISGVGSVLIGKFISKELVLRAAQTVGMRLTTAQAAKPAATTRRATHRRHWARRPVPVTEGKGRGTGVMPRR